MWFTYGGQLGIRHTCEHDLSKYGWTRHDGTSFGQQEILDNGMVGGGGRGWRKWLVLELYNPQVKSYLCHFCIDDTLK